MTKEKSKAVFFDRDGVINERIVGDYIKNWDEFHFLPEVGETIREARKRGYLCIIVSNQRGVGKGLFSEHELEDIHTKMQFELETTFGAAFDEIIVCTDATDDSPRRKPSPAMLLEAKELFNIDMANSWMIGDTASDIEAGNRAGTKTAFLLNEHETPPENATIKISSLKEILDYL